MQSIAENSASFNFHDFAGPKWFYRTFQVLEFSKKKSMTFQDFPGGVEMSLCLQDYWRNYEK